MSAVSINLIKAKRDRTNQLKALAAKIQFIALTIGAVYVVFLFLVVGVKTAMEAKADEVKREISQKELAITLLKSKEELLLLVNQKLSLSSKLLAENRTPSTLMKALLETLPETISVKSLEIGAKKEEGLSVQMEAPSWEEATVLLRHITAVVNAGGFLRIDIPAINRDKTGKFTVESNWQEKQS